MAVAAPAAVAGSGAEPTGGSKSRTAPIPAVAPAKPGTNCTVDATPQALASFKKIATDPYFRVNIGR